MNIEQLRTLKPQIQALARECKIDPDSIRVFGSVARGDATEQSDIDFFVRKLPGCGLLRIGGFYSGLEDLLHRKVDVVTADCISPNLLSIILSSSQLL